MSKNNPTLPTSDLKAHLEQLENALLSHHVLIWLLVSDQHFADGFGWHIRRGILESNDLLLERYEKLCANVTGTGLTDGHTVNQTEGE